MIETIVPASSVKKRKISDVCDEYIVKQGEGKCTVYSLLPGITLIYDDFHTDEVVLDYTYNQKILSVDFCSEGRIEWEHEDGSFCYLGERDVQVSVKNDHVARYGFPTGHYHGITVNFFIDDASLSLKELFPMFEMNLEELWERYSKQKDYFIRHTKKTVQRIFADLNQNRKNIQIDYLRIKIIELLYILSKTEQDDKGAEKPYFMKTHVEKVRKIKKHLCENTDLKLTLTQLSEDFDISQSVLRACFKAMYGQSVHAFAKQFRLEKAALLLRTTELSVTEISLESGYENPSKFISAFKGRFGKTPLKYRKK